MNQKGFTLIELIISTFIFSLIMVAILNFFIFGVKTQMYSFSSNNILNQTNYTIEYMSRFIRMAKNTSPSNSFCVKNGENFLVENNNSLSFIDYKNDCHKFYLKNGQIRENRVDEDGNEEDLPLTSLNFNVKNLEFIVEGNGKDDKKQPRVTILLEIEEKEKKANAPPVKIQTTITQRTIDLK